MIPRAKFAIGIPCPAASPRNPPPVLTSGVMDSGFGGVRQGAHITLRLPFDQALEKAIAALKAEGFGELTKIDVKATLKEKLDIDFQRYVILGACNPPLAHRALSADLDAGLLLPCNVIVYETSTNESIIGLVDPISMLGVLPNPGLEPVAQEARTRLERVTAALRE
jgi:uncharacterized protein (DUF302 family)